MLGPRNIGAVSRNKANGMGAVRNIQVDQAVLISLHINALAGVHLERRGAPGECNATSVDQADDCHPTGGLVATAQLQTLQCASIQGKLRELCIVVIAGKL